MSKTNTGPTVVPKKHCPCDWMEFPPRGHSRSCTLQLHWTMFGSEATAWDGVQRVGPLLQDNSKEISRTCLYKLSMAGGLIILGE